MKKNTIDRDYLMSLLDYDPETGLMRWKVRKARRIHVGDIAGRPNNHGYLQVGIDRRCYCVHRLAWLIVHGEEPPEEIDHIDRVKDNNRIGNLRLASRAENVQNTGMNPRNSSGFRGVIWNKKDKRWRAVINHQGQRHHLGSFETPEKASAAYIASAAKLHRYNPFAHGQVPQ